MDLSLLSTDDQTRSLPVLIDSQTRDLTTISSLHSPTEKTFSAYKTEAGTVSELSDAADKSTQTVSESLSQEESMDQDCMKSLSSGCNMSACLSLCLDSAPTDDECRLYSYFGPSEPLLPLLPHPSDGLISPQSQSELYIKEPTLSFSLIQKNSVFRPALQSTSKGVMQPSVTEPPSILSSSLDHVTSLLRSSPNRSDSLESDTAIALLEIEGGKADSVSDTRIMMGVPEIVEARSRHSEERVILDCESGMSQNKRPRPPAVGACDAVLMSVNDVRPGIVEVTDLTPHLQRTGSPVDLWLDACQYLAVEDTEEHSVIQGGLTVTSDLSFPIRETQFSVYKSDGGEGIGWFHNDTIGWGAPVERWSSVDSWASALSDWTEIITAPPVDLTAAFTEIGAEIDALTQALSEVNTHIDTETTIDNVGQEAAVQIHPLMGVQDQPLKAQTIPDSSALTGQSCLSLCLDGTEQEFHNSESSCRVESLSDINYVTQREKDAEENLSEPSPCPALQRSFMGSPKARVSSPGECGVDVNPGSASSDDRNLCHICGDVESLEILSDKEEEPIILNILEDTDLEGQKATSGPIIEEPFADGLCEVTDEHTTPVSQLGSEAKQEAKKSFMRVEAEREGASSSPDPHLLTTHTLNSHVPCVEKQPDLHENVSTCARSSPDLDGAHELRLSCGSAEFIMPLVPLCIGPIFTGQTNSSLIGVQTYATRSFNDNRDLCCVPWPTSDAIIVQPSLEDDKWLIHKKSNTIDSEKSSPQGQEAVETLECFITVGKTIIEEINDLSGELSKTVVIPSDHFSISEKNRVAGITLNLKYPYVSRAAYPTATVIKSEKADTKQKTADKMPHKNHKSTSESRTRSKKDKNAVHHPGLQASKNPETLSHHVSTQPVCRQQETHPPSGEKQTSENSPAGLEVKEAKLVTDTGVGIENAPIKPHSKKKKKNAQNAAGVKCAVEPQVEVGNGAKPKTTKTRIDLFETKLCAKAGGVQKDNHHSLCAALSPQPPVAKASQVEQHPQRTDHNLTKTFTSPLSDDIKRRRLSEDKFGKILNGLESKLTKPEVSTQSKAEEPKVDAGATPKKTYSHVVKQKSPPKEEPKVMKSIQAEAVSGDPESLCLCCQFAAVLSKHTVIWSRDGTVMSEIKRSAGDESRVSLIISSASNKDLGKYQCRLTSLHGSVTLDYLLTYEVLSEIAILQSPTAVSSATVEVGTEGENVQCSRLMFKEDFLSDQYFGKNQPVSIITEKVHFGEGMHRRAFRTKLNTGQIPLFLPGHSCVLKVHNAISYGTNNNDELIQKNFTLAVEECHVQNTAREYIKAYTNAAQSFQSFGEFPEIIPIYLVHRPSNDIPYATLEEELIGDFVKYSVKDGKEINLTRRDSEAGQKCCAFQHWVHNKTEGNLLVTDMQGVGMKLTDVGIATSKKGYKGFKGNCATSFIDQFKALHQCNKYCEMLGLKSLLPKAKKPAYALKPKPQPSTAPKKKTFGPSVKGKS